MRRQLAPHQPAGYLLRHPWQLGLAVLGVALGVAVVGLHRPGQRQRQRAFALSTETVTGTRHPPDRRRADRAATSVYRRLDARAGRAPRLRRWSKAMSRRAGSRLGGRCTMLGVDPFAEAPFRAYLGGADSERPAPSRRAPRAAAIDVADRLSPARRGRAVRATAASWAWRSGDPLAVRAAGVRRELSRRLLDPADGSAPRPGRPARHRHRDRPGDLRLDRPAQPHRPDPARRRGEQALLSDRAVLPPGASCHRRRAGRHARAQMTARVRAEPDRAVACWRWSSACSSSTTRSPSRWCSGGALIGTLRCLGVTARQMFALVLGEALIVGLIGRRRGWRWACCSARGLVGLVTQTINDLYFVVSVRGMALEPLVARSRARCWACGDAARRAGAGVRGDASRRRARCCAARPGDARAGCCRGWRWLGCGLLALGGAAAAAARRAWC